MFRRGFVTSLVTKRIVEEEISRRRDLVGKKCADRARIRGVVNRRRELVGV